MSAAPTIDFQRAAGSSSSWVAELPDNGAESGCADTDSVLASTRRARSSLTIKVCELYERDGLSTRRIADVLRISRQQVDRALRQAGVAVAARGAGRPRPTTRLPRPDDLAEVLQTLYHDQRLTRRQVSDRLDLTEGFVRDRLEEYGIATRTRGRCHREDRRELSEHDLISYYQDRELSAEAAGHLLGVSRRILLRAAHDRGVPVRPSAAATSNVGPIALIDALYADPLIKRTLRRHRVPTVAAGAPIWERFPDPVPLTAKLCIDLYVLCGVSTTQVELLTGQPAATIQRVLHGAGITLRPPGGRSPFRRRWDAAQRRQP